MTYDEMVEGLAEITGQPIEAVKDILYSLPDVLLDMKEGEKTYTPLGVFYMFRTKERTVIPPNQVDKVVCPSMFLVKLKPGERMRRPT